MQPSGSTVHHAILTPIVRRGTAPTAAERGGSAVPTSVIGDACGRRPTTTACAAPARRRGVGRIRSRPRRRRSWSAEGDRTWWCPCAWWALRAAALLDDGGQAVTITTHAGRRGRAGHPPIADGDLVDDGHVVHFPVPMRHAGDNVIHTCSVMLLFAAAADVDAWCDRHAVPRRCAADPHGVGVRPDLVRRHLDPDWRKWSRRRPTFSSGSA